MSKSMPLGASAEFAAAGKNMPKKSLGLMLTTYGYIYVAQVALGANPAQALRAIIEAEAYKGPSIVIAYATCIAHGIDMGKGIEEMRRAVSSGHWPLFRYNPSLAKEGKSPLVIDSAEPSIPLTDYTYKENRYRALRMSNPKVSEALMAEAQDIIKVRWNYLKHLAEWKP